MTQQKIIAIKAMGKPQVVIAGNQFRQWDGDLPRRFFYYTVEFARYTAQEYLDSLKKPTNNEIAPGGICITRDQYFADFWPRLPVEDATNVFHVTKRKLNEALALVANIEIDGDASRSALLLTDYVQGNYFRSSRLNFKYDVATYQEAIARAKNTRSIDDMLWAVSLYNGAFLPSFKEAWAIKVRQDLAQLQIDSLKTVATYFSMHGKHARAKKVLKGAVDTQIDAELVVRDDIEAMLRNLAS